MNCFRTRNAVTCLIAGTTMACFFGCSTTQPARHIQLALLPPAGAEVEATAGYEIVRWTLGETQLALSPRGSLEDLLDLWIAIENKGEEAVDFLPSQIRYAYCMPAAKPATRASDGTAMQSGGDKAGPWTDAIDDVVCTPFRAVPSQAQAMWHVAERQRQYRAADEADEAAVAIVLILTVVLIVAVLAAASSSSGSSNTGSYRGSSDVAHGGSPAFVPFRVLGHVAEAAINTEVYTTTTVQADTPAKTRTFFDGNLEHTIKQSTIAPGTYNAGHIFIPPHMNASLLRIEIGVGNDTTTVEFDYKPQPIRRGMITRAGR